MRLTFLLPVALQTFTTVFLESCLLNLSSASRASRGDVEAQWIARFNELRDRIEASGRLVCNSKVPIGRFPANYGEIKATTISEFCSGYSKLDEIDHQNDAYDRAKAWILRHWDDMEVPFEQLANSKNNDPLFFTNVVDLMHLTRRGNIQQSYDFSQMADSIFTKVRVMGPDGFPTGILGRCSRGNPNPTYEQFPKSMVTYGTELRPSIFEIAKAWCNRHCECPFVDNERLLALARVANRYQVRPAFMHAILGHRERSGRDGYTCFGRDLGTQSRQRMPPIKKAPSFLPFGSCITHTGL